MCHLNVPIYMCVYVQPTQVTNSHFCTHRWIHGVRLIWHPKKLPQSYKICSISALQTSCMLVFLTISNGKPQSGGEMQQKQLQYRALIGRKMAQICTSISCEARREYEGNQMYIVASRIVNIILRYEYCTQSSKFDPFSGRKATSKQLNGQKELAEPPCWKQMVQVMNVIYRINIHIYVYTSIQILALEKKKLYSEYVHNKGR